MIVLQASSSAKSTKKEYRTGRLMLSAAVIFTFLSTCFAAMLYCYDMYVQQSALHGALSVRGNAPLVAYSILPGITGAVFGPLSAKLNEFEKPLTEVGAGPILVISVIFSFN